jgi:flagellar biosynthesis GTPase FlhF
MEFSIREYIREIKNSVNVRLDMLESLISSKSTDKVEILISKIQVLEAKVDELMSSKKEELPSIIGIPNYDLYNRDNLKNFSVKVENDYCNNVLLSSDEETVDLLNKNIEVEEEEEEEKVEEQVEEQEEEQEEQVEEQEEQVEEQEEEEQEEEEQEEEEKEEEEKEEEEQEEEEEALIEFEYKGMVLYRDGENKVYQIDDEGELVDTPIGVWNDVKQKVIAIKN